MIWLISVECRCRISIVTYQACKLSNCTSQCRHIDPHWSSFQLFSMGGTGCAIRVYNSAVSTTCCGQNISQLRTTTTTFWKQTHRFSRWLKRYAISVVPRYTSAEVNVSTGWADADDHHQHDTWSGGYMTVCENCSIVPLLPKLRLQSSATSWHAEFADTLIVPEI